LLDIIDEKFLLVPVPTVTQADNSLITEYTGGEAENICNYDESQICFRFASDSQFVLYTVENLFTSQL
jgi:hypothetical protein